MSPISLLTNRKVEKGYLYEYKWLLKNAVPIIASYLLQNSLQSISIISAGHLGSLELASATLGSMFVTITGISVVTGATLSLDTLCSQSFTSAEDKTVVGLHVQRCLGFLSILYIPISILWWYAENVFLLLRQDPVVAALAGSYVRWMILGFPAFALFESLKKMLQAQSLFHAPTYALVIGALVNVLLNYVLIWIPSISIGFTGAAMASCISYWVVTFLMVVSIHYVNGSQVWPRWSTKDVFCFHQWKPMIQLAVPGILLICTETWAYEIIALAASWIDTVNLGAQSIIITSITALYTIAFGVGIAGANRVGNLLGAQKPKEARKAAFAAVSIGIIVGAVNSMVLLLLKSKWGYLFTNEEEVVSIVKDVLPYVAVFVFSDNIAGVADGVLNGMGRQHVGAWCNLVAYYFSALPLGFWLCFSRGWKLKGIWMALLLSLVVAALITILVVLTSNWNKEARKAEDRAKKEEDFIN